MIFGEQIRGAARVRKAERTLLLLRSEGRLATKIEISGISLTEYPVKMIFGEQIRGAARVRKAERTLLLLRSEGRLHLGRAKASFASALGLHCLS